MRARHFDRVAQCAVVCGIRDGWQTYFFGTQGWEFLELGRIWQDLLLADFGLWVPILFRGVQNFLT